MSGSKFKVFVSGSASTQSFRWASPMLLETESIPWTLQAPLWISTYPPYITRQKKRLNLLSSLWRYDTSMLNCTTASTLLSILFRSSACPALWSFVRASATPPLQRTALQSPKFEITISFSSIKAVTQQAPLPKPCSYYHWLVQYSNMWCFCNVQCMHSSH